MPAHQFHITGLHCKSCVALVESDLGEVPGVTRVSVSLRDHQVEVEGDFKGRSSQDIAADFNPLLQKHGYKLWVEKPQTRTPWTDFRFALPVACVLIAMFMGLQTLGVVHWVTTGSQVSPSTAFLVGVIASLSSCMAIVGGLLLSLSANFAKAGQRVRPQLLFHVGRLASFFVLGGVIGAAGSVFQFGDKGMFIVQVLVSATMLLLGVNLLDVFPWTKRLQPALPSFLAKHIQGLKDLNHTATPLLVGIATFFLPCGFTQGMQLYSITTGSFMAGATVMFFFALGTLPVLAMLSFSSSSVLTPARAGVFFKTAGLVVVFFAVFNLVNASVGAGIIPPSNSGGSSIASQSTGPASIEGPAHATSQTIQITAKAGYSPILNHAKAGVPLVLKIKTQATFDCSTSLRIASLNWSKKMEPTGEVTLSVPPQKPGTTLVGVCSMGMYQFTIDFD